MAGRRDVFEQAMSRGHSAAWDQQWDKALAYYRAALTEFPDDPNALTALGLVLFETGKLDDALATYQRAAVLTPGDPMAPEKCGEIFERLKRTNEAAQTYIAVAEIHLTRRDVQKAIDNWIKAVRLMPDHLNAHSRLALALERTGQNRSAALEYTEIARIFQKNREMENAGQAITRALQLGPNEPEVRDAVERLKRGLPLPVLDKAKLKPRQTGMLSPTAVPDEPPPTPKTSTGNLDQSPLAQAEEAALTQLAELLFEEDADTSKANTSVSALARGAANVRDEQSQRAQAIVFLGQALGQQSSGDVANAISNYRGVLDTGFDHPLVNFVLGALLLKQNRPAEAIDHLQTASTHKAVSLGALYGIGEAHRRLNQVRPACIALMSALKQLDAQVSPPNQLDALAEKYESLAESLTRANEADLTRTMNDLARYLSGADWETRARQQRQQLTAAAEEGEVKALGDVLIDPGSDQILEAMHRIDAYMRKKWWATALEEAYYALDYSPNYLPLHIRMAEILLAENKAEAASQKYSSIARTYQMRNEPARAAKMFQHMLRLNPLDLEGRARLIDMLTQIGQNEQAMHEYMDMAETHYQLTDLDAARRAYTDALRLAQQSGVDKTWQTRALHRIADIDVQRLAWRDAMRSYEQIKTLTPVDDKARIALINLMFRLGNSPQALAEADAYLRLLISMRLVPNAVGVMEELVLAHPEETTLLARLARLYQDQGRKDKALETYDRLAETQLEAGQTAQAIESIKALIAVGPDDPAPYQKLLAQLQGQ